MSAEPPRRPRLIEQRPLLSDPRALDALSHPVRLDVLGYLMSAGPATASECARAVGDTPSNCSYHLRILSAFGLVERAEGDGDARTKPWRSTITGFDLDQSDPETRHGIDTLAAATLQLDHQLAREHIRVRETLPPEWREVDFQATYGLLATPEELTEIQKAIDTVVRPYISATRSDAPDEARHVHLSTMAFPRSWGPR
ncbi:winged helix-turn-helix domain-containing protein [Frondihabitans cladoniiphilus]|uniref:Helix-turn-helix domain-containing protein n=1 Tax=Frondihabitans cladoniiphilus TaxID=715785 RepID=A0ABP8WC77_9MICO